MHIVADGVVVQSEQMETKENTPVDETANRELKIDQNADSITTVPETVEQPAKLTKDIVKIEENRDREGEGYSGSEDSDSNQNQSQGVKIPKERRSYYESTEKYRKTLRLSSAQIVCKIFLQHSNTDKIFEFLYFVCVCVCVYLS